MADWLLCLLILIGVCVTWFLWGKELEVLAERKEKLDVLHRC